MVRSALFNLLVVVQLGFFLVMSLWGVVLLVSVATSSVLGCQVLLVTAAVLAALEALRRVRA